MLHVSQLIYGSHQQEAEPPKREADSDSTAALQNLPGSSDQRCALMEPTKALDKRSRGFRDWIFGESSRS